MGDQHIWIDWGHNWQRSINRSNWLSQGDKEPRQNACKNRLLWVKIISTYPLFLEEAAVNQLDKPNLVKTVWRISQVVEKRFPLAKWSPQATSESASTQERWADQVEEKETTKAQGRVAVDTTQSRTLASYPVIIITIGVIILIISKVISLNVPCASQTTLTPMENWKRKARKKATKSMIIKTEKTQILTKNASIYPSTILPQAINLPTISKKHMRLNLEQK